MKRKKKNELIKFLLKNYSTNDIESIFRHSESSASDKYMGINNN